MIRQAFSILLISFFAQEVLAQQEPGWDSIEGLTNIDANYYEVQNQGWSNSYLLAGDLKAEAKSSLTVLQSIEINPGDVSGDFISGFFFGIPKSTPLAHKDLTYSFSYTSDTRTLYLVASNKVIMNLGRISKPTTVSFEERNGELLVKVSGRTVRTIELGTTEDTYSLGVYGYAANSRIPTCTTGLVGRAWITGDLKLFSESFVVKLNKEPIDVDNEGQFTISKSQLNLDSKDEIIIQPTIVEEIEWAILQEVDSDGLLQESSLYLDGSNAGSAASYALKDKTKRELTLSPGMSYELPEYNVIPYRLSLVNGLAFYPNTAAEGLILLVDQGYQVEQSQYSVMDSSGAEVFSSDDALTRTWDGRVEGQIVEGAYSYQLVVDHQSFTGQFYVYED